MTQLRRHSPRHGLHRHIRAVALLLATVAFVLAACGPGTGATSGPGGTMGLETTAPTTGY